MTCKNHKKICKIIRIESQTSAWCCMSELKCIGNWLVLMKDSGDLLRFMSAIKHSKRFKLMNWILEFKFIDSLCLWRESTNIQKIQNEYQTLMTSICIPPFLKVTWLYFFSFIFFQDVDQLYWNLFVMWFASFSCINIYESL